MPKIEKEKPINGELKFENLKMSPLLLDKRLAGLLSLYLDNSLSGDELIEFDALLLEKPELAREVEEMQRVEQGLKLMGQEILQEPVPEALLKALRSVLDEDC